MRQITEQESRELIHDSYVMYIHHQDCLNCNCAEEYSQMYEVWIHPIKTRTSGFRDLRFLTSSSLQDHLPIAAVALTPRQIPYCSECIMTYKPRETGNTIPLVSRNEWAATLKRKYTPAAQPPKAARATPTLDQI
jgi:hypothetical protein